MTGDDRRRWPWWAWLWYWLPGRIRRRRQPAAGLEYDLRDVEQIQRRAQQIAELAGLDHPAAAWLAEQWASAPTPEPPADRVRVAPRGALAGRPGSYPADVDAATSDPGGRWVALE